jgi:hypothetical protein
MSDRDLATRYNISVFLRISAAVLLIVSGCYEPLDQDSLCHPLEPECANADADQDGVRNADDNCLTDPNPQQEDRDLDGIGDLCDPCPDAVCGNGCGTCPEGIDCVDGRCICEFGECDDHTCRPQGGCCEDAECGSGAWVCTADHTCSCEARVCADGTCLAADECCTDIDDDAVCGSGRICENRVCVAGPDGELVIDGSSCTLNGSTCPSDKLSAQGLNWTLLQSLYFTHVTVRGGAILTAPRIDQSGGGGTLQVRATGTVTVEAGSIITMSGRGHGGGGGGGGIQYCDSQAQCRFGRGGEVGSLNPDGEPGQGSDLGTGPIPACLQGYDPSTVGSGAGGAGGGHGGQPGQNGGACASRCTNPPHPMGDSSGGQGGGSYGGLGGTGTGYSNKCPQNIYCDGAEGPSGAPIRDPEQPAQSGMHGGYTALGSNGDSTQDESVLLGSGGGGGAGGMQGSSYCCGAADGGNGGASGGEGFVGCTGGGGGGGGAAGGGSIEIRARDIVVSGRIAADGAGRADLSGGFGAGGGILLYARHTITFNASGVIRSLGGFSDGTGTTSNGGTIKLFYRNLSGTPPPPTSAGRVFTKDLEQ